MIDLSYIVPTIGRPELLRLLPTLLDQRDIRVEVVAVFDGTTPTLGEKYAPNVRVVKTSSSRGPLAARNLGAMAAKGRVLSFVDDDDWVSEWHGFKSLEALHASDGPSVVVSGISGHLGPESGPVYTRLPPRISPRGRHWNLSTALTWHESLTKQSAVVTKDFFASIGGFNENVRGREWTEFFWRANHESCVVGVQEVLYFRQVWERHQKSMHRGGPTLVRWRRFQNLIRQNRELLKNHPQGFARMLSHHEKKLRATGSPVLGMLARYRNLTMRRLQDSECGYCESY